MILIILGAPIEGLEPGPDLKERLDGKIPNKSHILLSGGKLKTCGSQGINSEAFVMKNYLEKQFPDFNSAFNVQLDHEANNTFDNFTNSFKILQDQSIFGDISVITHDWHVERSRHLAEAVFAKPIEFLPIPSDPQNKQVSERIKTEKFLVYGVNESSWINAKIGEWKRYAVKGT